MFYGVSFEARCIRLLEITGDVPYWSIRITGCCSAGHAANLRRCSGSG